MNKILFILSRFLVYSHTFNLFCRNLCSRTRVKYLLRGAPPPGLTQRLLVFIFWCIWSHGCQGFSYVMCGVGVLFVFHSHGIWWFVNLVFVVFLYGGVISEMLLCALILLLSQILSQANVSETCLSLFQIVVEGFNLCIRCCWCSNSGRLLVVVGVARSLPSFGLCLPWGLLSDPVPRHRAANWQIKAFFRKRREGCEALSFHRLMRITQNTISLHFWENNLDQPRLSPITLRYS